MKPEPSNLAANSVPPTPPALASVSGSASADELMIAFIQGAAWWEWHSRGATMWASDRDKAEAEAQHRLQTGFLGGNPRMQNEKLTQDARP